jgi:dTDP-4-amino-4,6-dideoxygalactose transaminase
VCLDRLYGSQVRGVILSMSLKNLRQPAGVPFSRLFLTGNERKYVTQAVTSVASDGPFTRRCAQILRQRFCIQSLLMVPSCTAALEMAAMLCELGPEDEVILPSFTFTSTANAIVQRGAKPVFVDIRPDTLNIDEDQVERRITRRTKAIFAVHYAGIACEMDRLVAIAAANNLRVVEDAAQAVNSSYKGRALGSIGHLGAFSFHSTKDYSCGEGGALCINSPELIERAEIIRDKGTDRSRFLRGQVGKYTWVDVGSSYVPTELACAYLCAQLECMDRIKALRRTVYERYRTYLAPLEQAGLLRLPTIPAGCDTNYHLFYVLCQNKDTRDRLITYLHRYHIEAFFHFVPLHSSSMGGRLGYKEGDLPVTEHLSGCLLRLPFYPELTEDEQITVAESISAFFDTTTGGSHTVSGRNRW